MAIAGPTNVIQVEAEFCWQVSIGQARCNHKFTDVGGGRGAETSSRVEQERKSSESRSCSNSERVAGRSVPWTLKPGTGDLEDRRTRRKDLRKPNLGWKPFVRKDP